MSPGLLEREKMAQSFHVPVMLPEVIEHLVTDPDGLYLDATVGLGGHTLAILESLSPKGRLLGLDWDPAALEMARSRLLSYPGEVLRLEEANFRGISSVLERLEFGPLQGALFDLGVSSYHFEEPSRGFSFQQEGPLDMRLSPRSLLKASDIVNEWPEEKLSDMFFECGERRARSVARAIVERRTLRPFLTTTDLSRWLAGRFPSRGLHPATKVFLALRMAVNSEPENLKIGLEQAASHMAPGGRIAVITFHSLEDRPVKQIFKSWAESGSWRKVFKKPLTPSLEEVRSNPRARSAKLRVIEKAARPPN